MQSLEVNQSYYTLSTDAMFKKDYYFQRYFIPTYMWYYGNGMLTGRAVAKRLKKGGGGVVSHLPHFSHFSQTFPLLYRNLLTFSVIFVNLAKSLL
jgi:hypothetical protein